MKEVLQIAYLRHLQDFYLFESVKDGNISLSDRIARGFFYFLVKISTFYNYSPAVFVRILPVH